MGGFGYEENAAGEGAVPWITYTDWPLSNKLYKGSTAHRICLDRKY